MQKWAGKKVTIWHFCISFKTPTRAHTQRDSFQWENIFISLRLYTHTRNTSSRYFVKTCKSYRIPEQNKPLWVQWTHRAAERLCDVKTVKSRWGPPAGGGTRTRSSKEKAHVCAELAFFFKCCRQKTIPDRIKVLTKYLKKRHTGTRKMTELSEVLQHRVKTVLLPNLRLK